LIQNEKMAHWGNWFAGIAHEINNPLAFVLNNLFIVESGLDALRPDMEPHLSETSLRKLGESAGPPEGDEEGLDRVKELVLDYGLFPRLDEEEFKTWTSWKFRCGSAPVSDKMNGRIPVEKHYAQERTLFCHARRLSRWLNRIDNFHDVHGFELFFIEPGKSP